MLYKTISNHDGDMRLSGWTLIVCLTIGGCKGQEGTMDYPKQIMVENTMVFDSVHTSFRLRNRSSEPMELDIIPECDCTRVYPEHVTVPPHCRQKVSISFWVSSAGAYERILYLQREGDDAQDTVVIKGYAEK